MIDSHVNKDSKSILEMRAFRRELSAGASTEKLLHVLLLETVSAMDVSSGALYLLENDHLETFGKIQRKGLTKPSLRSLIANFEDASQELCIDKPFMIAAPLRIQGHTAGVICVIDRQFDKGIGKFTSYDKAILIALAATASITLERNLIAAENRQLKSQIEYSQLSDPIIGTSAVIREVCSRIHKIAQQEIKVSILIEGENGVGKELVARAIHQQSSRKEKPFMALNCVSIPENLLESELFGYEKGAFTGANDARPGKFEAANGGILFLDEIGEMSPNLQTKLLRVLEDGSFSRLGSNKVLHSDFQLISATNKLLIEEVKRGNFREDLYYRLKTFIITVPPLRERLGDIQVLINYFLKKLNQQSKKKQIKGVFPQALLKLKQFNWPGNVRELQHCIEHAYVLCEKELIDIEHLPLDIVQPTSEQVLQFSEVIPLEEAIAKYVKYAFDKEKRHTLKTMGRLNIDHRRLQRYLGARIEKHLHLPIQQHIELEALKAAEKLFIEFNLNNKQQVAVRRSLIEAIINAVEHSGNKKGKIKVDFLVTPTQFKVSVSDRGRGFKADQITPVDYKEKYKKGEMRGWGFHIIKKAMDDVKIHSDKSGTSVVMTLNR